MRHGEAVFVEASARLHMGVLDLRRDRGRWFGGIGAAAPGPSLLLSASAADSVEVRGEDAARAAEFAARYLAHHGIRRGARIQVHRALPAHAGLGSGTQLALAVGRSLAELFGLDTGASALARAVGRGRRSAVGTWTFAGAGLVVEGGRQQEAGGGGPLISRLPFPASWRCVVAVPDAASSVCGADEAAAFERLEPPPGSEVDRVAHLVLMELLPALAEADIEAFGAALFRIQELTGRWFAAVQGGAFAPGLPSELVRRMREWGASGVGQSSWGPTVYGIVAGDEAAALLMKRVHALMGEAGQVYAGAFPATGARVWRAQTAD